MTTHTPDVFRAKTYDVFVSYKREDDAAREALVGALQAAGYEVFWDAKLNNDDWKGELRDEINRCGLVICLWSQRSARSEYVKAEAYHAFGVRKLLSAPIEDKSVVPDYFKDTNLHPFDGWADEGRRPAQIAKILGTVERVTGGPRRAREKPMDTAASTLVASPEFGDIPGAPDKLIGRDAELAMLRQAWASRLPKKVNAVVLHALGGAGKSALLRTFANELLAQGGGGASRIYGWSAYSQGSGEQKRADADGFISKALGDFGWQGALPADPLERARALAKLVQKERTLLLLDGLEPLQDPPGVNKGRFKDKGLAELIKRLAGLNPGLVVLTTRQEVPEFDGFGPVVINHELNVLSDHVGADLLVELGVRGRQRELEAAVHDLEGHALSVTLLGNFLAEVCGGDIRHRDRFDFKRIALSPEEQSELATDKTIVSAKRAAKVMRGYLEQFEKLGKDKATKGLGGPERALLHVLGLFDRPADGPAVDALLAQHIAGLTDELFFETIVLRKGFLGFGRKTQARPLTPGERSARLREAKSRLRKLQLLSKANPNDPHELDAHPIVRAFFAGLLEGGAPDSAKAAHDILYRHYSAAAPDLPDTLDEMQPLFHAVQHGVKAGHVKEAFEQVLKRRIRRGYRSISIYQLGAFGADLVCLSFFLSPIDRMPLLELDADQRRWVCSGLAVDYEAIGRLIEAEHFWKKGIAICQDEGADEMEVGFRSQLTRLLLLRGEIKEVSDFAARNVIRSRHLGEAARARSFADRGIVEFLSGDLASSLKSFVQAFEIKGSSMPHMWGYWYVQALIAKKAIHKAGEEADKQSRMATSYKGRKKGIANQGVANLVQFSVDATRTPALTDVVSRSIEQLRVSGQEQLLPLALLARAAHRRRRAVAGERDLIDGIRTDLAEVEDIAGEEMRLYLTDLALERARFALDVASAFASPQAARAEAQTQTAKAAQLIADTGYHRRDGELAELKARLAA